MAYTKALKAFGRKVVRVQLPPCPLNEATTYGAQKFRGDVSCMVEFTPHFATESSAEKISAQRGKFTSSAKNQRPRCEFPQVIARNSGRLAQLV